MPCWRHLALGTLLAAAGDGLLAQPRPAGPPPGVLVDVGGHRLHLRCVGPTDARPTVVLEAGGGAYSAAWAAVQELLAPRVRSCAYDRAGAGWSEPGPAPRTMRQEAFELHALLASAGVRTPVVLVGHSIGGLLARVYAERYPADVAGAVLVDATHESAVLGNVRLGGWVRMRELATGRAIPEPRREGAPPGAEYDPEQDYFSEELDRLHRARAADPRPLGDCPLVVLAAGRRSAPPGTSDSLWRVLRREKDEQGVDLARLSRNARFVLDPASGHDIPRDNPRLVARAIEDVVDAASRRARLVP
jgi:pimeloyl-ACP methyl ester carboxylesterase